MVLGRIEMSAAQLQRGGAVQLKGGPKRQPSWRATLAPHVVHLGRDRTEIPPAQKAEGSDRARRQRPLPVSRRGGSTGNGREGDEKRVSLGVDLDTALGGESLSQQPAMRSQRLAVLLRPYPLQQTGWNLRYP